MADDLQGTAAPETKTETPAAPTVEKPRVQAAELPPEALKARLDSAKDAARRELLADLGVSDPRDVKAALEELKKRQDAERSELERATGRVKELEARAEKATAYEVVIAGRASAEMAGLDDRAKAFVTAEAGDDPAKQLATIDRLRASGLMTVATPAPVAPPATPPAAPVNTAPRPNAPAEAGAAVVTDVRATYKRLNSENPFAAAAFAQSNAASLFFAK